MLLASFLLINGLFFLDRFQNGDCLHDLFSSRAQIDREFYRNQTSASSNRILQAEEWRPIRITVDFSNMPLKTDENHLMVDFLSNTVVKEAIKAVGSNFKVAGPKIMPLIQRTSCDSFVLIPKLYAKNELDSDLLVLAKMVEEPEEYFAWATPCLLSSFDYRPIVILLQLNAKSFFISPGRVQESIMIAQHELFHALGFSESLFSMFPIGVEKTIAFERINGKNRTKVILPGVIEAAKNHFGCDRTSGVLLEYSGSQDKISSHWDKALLGNDLMTSSVNGRMIISSLTLSFLNEIGWYQVNLTSAERLEWGRGRGCDFGLSCSGSSEFCTELSQMDCTSDYFSKTVCSANPLNTTCRINDYQRIFDCQNSIDFNFWVSGTAGRFEAPGIFSRCFKFVTNTLISSAGCFPSFCQLGSVILTVGTTNFTCKKIGDVVEAGGVNVTCPDPDTFCSFWNRKGVNDCSANGVARNDGSCRCNYLFHGEDCSEKLHCHNGESDSLCEIIQSFGEEKDNDLSSHRSTSASSENNSGAFPTFVNFGPVLSETQKIYPAFQPNLSAFIQATNYWTRASVWAFSMGSWLDSRWLALFGTVIFAWM